MTTRERREQRAERLREWADKREQAAATVHESHERFHGCHAFNFQPGHIPLRAKVIAATDRALESERKARGMSSRAAGIEQQLAGAIYSDDPDAIEQLEQRLAALEAERETIKQRNAAYRKAHAAELRALTPYQRDQALPHRGYELRNLGGNITRTRKRIEQLKRERDHGPADRIIAARYAGECATCGRELERGQMIRYNRQAGARCVTCEPPAERPRETLSEQLDEDQREQDRREGEEEAAEQD